MYVAVGAINESLLIRLRASRAPRDNKDFRVNNGRFPNNAIARLVNYIFENIIIIDNIFSFYIFNKI